MDMRLEVVVVPVSRRGPGQGLLQGAGVAAGRRLHRQRGLPGGAADPARLSLLGDHWHRDQLGRAGLGAGPESGRGRHRRGPGRIDQPRRPISARCSTTRAGCSTTPAPRDASPARRRTIKATARSPRSATRTATSGSSRRSPPACRAGDRVPDLIMADPPAGQVACPGQAMNCHAAERAGCHERVAYLPGNGTPPRPCWSRRSSCSSWPSSPARQKVSGHERHR